MTAGCQSFPPHAKTSPNIFLACEGRPGLDHGLSPRFCSNLSALAGADPKNSGSRWPGNMPEFYKNNFQTSKEKGVATAPSAHLKSALGQSLSVARSLPGDSAV